eukprot:TRINITY_DN6328_c0_g1_i1.p1 TRINITY_DN6328_c0_g1~~TRINITY_DN6328_c0_g1_i1.p1  ORF type:complete len:503 (+),score=68.60 TRINITY_DN6328_c0_g1_i1:474-1982(+)
MGEDMQQVVALRVQQQVLAQQLRQLQLQEQELLQRTDAVDTPVESSSPPRTGPCERAGSRLSNREAVDRPTDAAPAPAVHKDSAAWGPRDSVSDRLQEKLGQLTQIARDAHGCRYLQSIIEEGAGRDISVIFEELFDSVPALMVDPVGQFLILKLCEHCSEAERTVLVRKVANGLSSVAFSMHGALAVQRIFDHLRTQEQFASMVRALSSHVVDLVKDVNGNHVIQKCLQRFENQDKQFIYDALADRLLECATHRHGCCILQRCIDFGSDEQKMQLVMEIIANVVAMVKDPFGNYVVQYVLDLGMSFINVRMIRNLLGSVAMLSMNKFSSNVIEKCIRQAPEDVKQLLIEEITEPSELPQLLRDQFANYVVQTALNTASPAQFQMMAAAIRPHIPGIRCTSHGKKIENKINRGYTGSGVQGQHPDRRHVKGRRDRGSTDLAPQAVPAAAAWAGSDTDIRPHHSGRGQPQRGPGRGCTPGLDPAARAFTPDFAAGQFGAPPRS